jgi:hypothetical protein
MKFDWKETTLDLLNMVRETVWLILGASVGAWGVATQPDTAELWRQPNVPALIAALFVVTVLLTLAVKGLVWWWNRQEAAHEPA